MTSQRPDRLQINPVIEALCELRFDSEESSSLPELVVSRLADAPGWSSGQMTRLPLAEFPPQIREQDPNLRDQPTLEVRLPGSPEFAVKIGPRVVSYHCLGNYPGWNALRPGISGMIEQLFKSVKSARVRRVGLRYINLLSFEHGVESVADLDCDVMVGGSALTHALNLNYQKHGETFSSMVRIATPEFVQTAVNRSYSALIDIDVFNRDHVSFSSPANILDYVEQGHNFEKDRFFELMPDSVVAKMNEKV
ncbi:MAG TPA: TIGR04255 family protein [Devosia sp.]|nr:TIGR04255 family protein [Devosia sp.]